MAAMDGRFSVSLDDIRKVAVPVLRHRISTNFPGPGRRPDHREPDQAPRRRDQASPTCPSTSAEGPPDPNSGRSPDDGDRPINRSSSSARRDEGRLVSSEEFAEADFDEPWKYEREDGRLIVLAPSGEGHLDATIPWRDELIVYRA